jgi:hypothetical protein
MSKRRIENIRTVKLNGKNVKVFDLYEYNADQKAYVFAGQYSAPAKTANKDLGDYTD